MLYALVFGDLAEFAEVIPHIDNAPAGGAEAVYLHFYQESAVATLLMRDPLEQIVKVGFTQQGYQLLEQRIIDIAFHACLLRNE
ncbi:hypothetical protein [Aeromonas schubertii]|uniref:hypothetical protein n=1 Tax=Aeromonas schubertii TaxID=652 RepID=UPI001E3BF7F0|nr:hypothetical protein [Aeromonas schubertii]